MHLGVLVFFSALDIELKKKSETVRLSGMGRADVGMSSFPLKKEELESSGSDNIARVL